MVDPLSENHEDRQIRRVGVRENFTSPTAWMIDLLNFTLGLGPLVRSWLSSPSTLGHQLLLASKVCKVASLQRHDLIKIWGFNNMYMAQEFYM